MFQGFEQLHHACFVLVRVSVAPEKLCKAVRRIAPAAGLPDELQICDLRRTAATEGASAGATPAEMMAVGVWANPASIVHILCKHANKLLRSRQSGTHIAN